MIEKYNQKLYSVVYFILKNYILNVVTSIAHFVLHLDVQYISCINIFKIVSGNNNSDSTFSLHTHPKTI